MLAILYFLAATVHYAQAANHTMLVGGSAGLVFTPSNITAAVGDFVTFVFQAKNHTVTQSGFAKPCQLLQNASINAVGFDSGYVPVSANATEFPAWTVQITAASPIWFYCKQGNHCQQGMVGSINAATTGNKTFEAFKALAKSSNVAASAAGAPAGPYASMATTGAATSLTYAPTATGIAAAGDSSLSSVDPTVAAAVAAAASEATRAPSTGAADRSAGTSFVSLAGALFVAFLLG